MNTENSCYLCESNLETLYILNPGNSAPSNIVSCEKCGFLRLSPLPNFSTLDQIYNAQSSEKQLEFEVFTSKYLTQFKKMLLVKPLLNRLKNLSTKKKPSLLDIGCSTGWITSVARDAGFEVTGLEVNPHFARYGREKYNLNIIESYVEDFKSYKEYDAISMFHILEHIPDPISVLKKIHSLLIEEGKLLIVVPNSKSLGVSIFKEHYNWSAPQHISFFSPETIRIVLEKSGFRTIKIKHLLSPPLLLYSYNNLMNDKYESRYMIKNPFFGNLVFTPLAILGKLIQKGEVISIYAVKD